jgi:hypothetical protein
MGCSIFQPLLRERRRRNFQPESQSHNNSFAFEAVDFREKPDLIGNARQRPHCIAFWLLAFLEGFRRDFTTGQEGMGGTRKTAFTTGCSLRHGLDVLGMLQTESRWTAARRQVFGTLTDKGRGASLKI